MGEDIGSILSIIGALVLMIAVFVGAYLVSKFVGKRYQSHGPTMGGSIDLLARRPLGREQNLLIVRAAGKVFLLGVTADHIETISELDPAAFPVEAPAAPASSSFSKVFKDMLKQKGAKPPEGGSDYADRK